MKNISTGIPTSTVIFLTLFIIHGVASPFEEFDTFKVKTNERQSLFKIISDIDFSWVDIAAMYKDVTAEERTIGCPGTCRTPIALWVLQSVSPCVKIMKEDCSKGLVCCFLAKNVDVIISEMSTANNTVDSLEVRSDIDPVSFVQDPIPGDSDEAEYKT